MSTTGLLKRYKQKRDFTRTPEPDAKSSGASVEPIFVIQKHAAHRLHYDFRLEAEGVLKSWAVPKGPSTNPQIKRLAVPTEDHPIPYAKFEGVIPSGEYGGGNVIVWDRGTYENKTVNKGRIIPLEEGIKRGHIAIRLKGEKLQGGYALTRVGTGEKPSWLFVKIQDDEADSEHDIVETHPNSVISDRSIESIALKNTSATRSTALVKPAKGHKTLMPEWISPMLATLSEKPFDHEDWIFEPKLDGQRILAFIDGKTVVLYSRSRQNITATYPEIVEALKKQSLKSAILDGEVVAFRPNSQISSFHELQQRMHLHQASEVKKSNVKVYYFLFDLLYLNGEDFRKRPLIDRKQQLDQTIQFNSLLLRNPIVEKNGVSFFKQACQARWEGVIAKSKQSSYVSGRSREWLKLKCVREQEFVIGGYTDPQGTRDSFGALLLGYFEGKVLKFAGKVGTGFDAKTLSLLWDKMKPIKRDTSPFASIGVPTRTFHWVEPTLVAQIGFGEWTPDGKLRHPRFVGLREDKRAKEVMREEPEPGTPEPKATPVAKIVEAPKRKVKGGSAKIEIDRHSLELSHLDKIFYPATGFTKGEFLDYYTKISPFMLPHLKGRPVTMKRFPNGVEGDFFYEKQAPSYRPEWLETYRMREESSGKTTEYGVVNKLSDLLWMANLATIEFHCLLARAPQVDQPTCVAFDFDPGAPASFLDCAKVAIELRDLLKSVKLKSFLKTSGNKGLHLYVPLNTKTSYALTQEFAHAVALTLERSDPKRVISVMRRELRAGKVFVDWSQNSRHKTTVSAYSMRAVKEPSVSTPIDWSELEQAIRKKSDAGFRFGPEAVLKRVEKDGDLFAPVQTLKQMLPKFGKP